MIAIQSNPLEKFGSTSQERLDNAFKHLQNGKGVILTDDKGIKSKCCGEILNFDICVYKICLNARFL
jgi:hypothetical protein